MMTASRNGFLLVMLLGGAIAGCNTADEESKAWSTGKPVVAVTNYPLRYFVEQIGGDDIEVLYLVEPDIDPAFWKPSSEAIGQLQQADLVLLNGAGYEKWLTGVTLSASKLADTSRAISDRLIELDGAIVHQHGPEGDHSHTGYAFTTWLDPQLALSQAAAVRNELAKLAPDSLSGFDSRLAKLQQSLRDIDQQYTGLAQQVGRQHLIGSHPVYQYLIRRMNLNMHSVHFEPDEPPTDEQWQELDELVEANPTKLMLWEGQPLDETVQKLKDRGIDVVVIDPLGNQPIDGDFVSGMLANIERLRSAMD